MVLLAVGCGDDPAGPGATSQPPAAQQPTAPATPADRPPTAAEVSRQIDSLRLGGEKAMESVIAGASAQRVGAADAPAPIKAAHEAEVARGIVVGDSLVRLERPPGAASGDGWLGGKVHVTLPLTPEQLAIARDDNVGAVYLSELGAFFIRGRLDRSAGTVTFATEHFSYFGSAVQRAEAEVADFIKKKAEAGVEAATGMVTDKLKDAIDSYLDQVLPDSVKDSVKMKVLQQVWDRREEIAELAKAGGEDDPQGLIKSAGVLVGKVLIDQLDEGTYKTVLSDMVDKAHLAQAAPEAVKKAREGDYWAAVEVMGRAYSQETPIYKTVTGAAAEVQKRIDDWKQHEWETAYVAYTRGAPGSFMGVRRPVQAGDWEQLTTSYGGIVDHVRKKYRIDDPERASAFARKLFDQRQAREADAAKEQARLSRWYEVFNGKTWSGQADYLRTAGLEGRSKKEQFAYFLRTVNTIERDLLELGIPGRAMYWTNIEKGTWGLNPHARELLSAFALGGARGYQAKLDALRQQYAKPVAAVPEARPAQPQPQPPARRSVRYAANLTGDWADAFEFELISTAGVMTGRHQPKIKVGDALAASSAVWRGEYSRATKLVRGEIKGTYLAGQTEGFNGPEDQWLGIKGTFQGKFVEGATPSFEGTWTATAQGVTYSGAWKAQLVRDR